MFKNIFLLTILFLSIMMGTCLSEPEQGWHTSPPISVVNPYNIQIIKLQ